MPNLKHLLVVEQTPKTSFENTKRSVNRELKMLKTSTDRREYMMMVETYIMTHSHWLESFGKENTDE